MNKSALITLFLCIAMIGFGQKSVKDSIIGTPWVGVQYTFHVPGGDLMERFGINHGIGLKVAYKTKKNWVYGAEGNFIFGSNFKETEIFESLYGDNGEISDINGSPADVLYYMRGFNVNAIGGKLFPWFGPNKNSGLLLELGVGFIAHKIRIETQDHDVPQLEGDYLKGYDRLSSGAHLSQFLGYAHMGNKGSLNFYAGFYFMQGFTKERRKINFDTKLTDNSSRIDIQYGIRLGWMVPIYKRASKKRYY